MKIKYKLVHYYDDKKIIDLDIVQENYYVEKNLYISKDIEDAWEFKSIKEYIKKSKKKFNSKFICVTKFSCFEIVSYKNSTSVYFIELVK